MGSRMVVEQLRQLSDAGAVMALDGPQAENMLVGRALGVATVQVARRVRFNGLRLGEGDVVFLHGAALKVRACAQAGCAFWVLVSPMKRRSSGLGCSTWVMEVICVWARGVWMFRRTNRGPNQN